MEFAVCNNQDVQSTCNPNDLPFDIVTLLSDIFMLQVNQHVVVQSLSVGRVQVVYVACHGLTSIVFQR